MKHAEKIKRELASYIGCSPEELAGENIIESLRAAEQNNGGFQVLWAVVEATINPNDVFPS